MKLKYILTTVFAACLLTGCGDKKANSSNNDAKTDSATTTSTVSSTTAKTTTTAKKTTTTVTTTAKVDPPKDLVMNCRDTVEVYEDIKLEDFITEKNVDLKDGSVLLNTSDTGVFEVEVPYIYKGAEFKQKLQYSVIDTTDPLIINAGWTPNHKVGTDFDLNNYVGFADNFDKHPVLTYEGEVDPNAVGSYPITATVTDSSGNSVSWDLNINVLNEVPKPVDNNPRVNYSDFINTYNTDDVRFGIDVSVWQSDVDFNAVRDAGCSFVIIRVGYYYSQITLDDYFRQNLENAKAAGLDVGVYFYTTDNTEEGVREHVRWIIDQLDGQSLEMPIVFDWEEFTNFQKYGMSIHDINDIYAAFADEVTKNGYKPMLYSSKNFLNNIWSERTKSSTPVWLAHFVDETDYDGEYAIWQASAYGHIPGINGDVDMDIQYLNQPIN
ncbi:Lyzozyme M1 (1,4-beta-N-acetylmuramidase), GH25 family [Ruminococcus flavefaciens]|uniref:Lyzozyme M1 (1,4-beta-N-acetylmuramidase), GH25 family n=1 Tax=Ruminococcus flavefaciens TaxID=1265 RepID=A0A1H6K1B4_RUMFL|nr:GH25 family lysozyme [Ruminococcus flavefaciens]SEH65179.1 Lyzozyme M1 (1,4-beta-N-acetylmuramidase), GH25 family [Ruminococcus flavefaciens]